MNRIVAELVHYRPFLAVLVFWAGFIGWLWFTGRKQARQRGER